MFLILLSRSRYTSEYYFFQVLLADIIAYSTRKAKVFCLDISLLIVNSEVDLTTSSPISTSVIYTDSSFINTSPDVSLPSMTSVWMALNDILESSFACLPSTFPSTLRSEIATLLYTLCALVSSFSVFLYTDYASIIFFWHQYIDRPFLPDFLKQTSIWNQIYSNILDNDLHNFWPEL
ncbi:12639_t:CDS:2 [Rhizophagus irregularis]|nr:12639_t:CDS:2 [Rhizophagus irregularis]